MGADEQQIRDDIHRLRLMVDVALESDGRRAFDHCVELLRERREQLEELEHDRLSGNPRRSQR